MSKTGVPIRGYNGGADSLFVSMSLLQRVLVVAFVIIYNVLAPGFSEVFHQPTLPLATARFTVELCYQLLLVLPFIYHKSGFGWLHPLILTVVWSLAQHYVGDPESLLGPFRVLFEPLHAEWSHQGLPGFSDVDVAWTLVKTEALKCISLLAYYLGFFSGLCPRVPSLKVYPPKKISIRTLLLVGAALAAFAYAVQMRGGIVQHFLSFAGGRHEELGGLGHFGVLVRGGVLASVVWYAADQTAGKNPLFWGVTLLSLAIVFLWNGSRSDVIFPMGYMLLIWMFRNRKVPWFKGVIAAFVALLLFGMLGLLRSSTSSGKVAWTVLTEFNVERSLEYADEQLERRTLNPGGSLSAVVGRVPKDVDYLYGRTYVGAVLFFVPRAIWENKPRATGPYVVEYLYGNPGRAELRDSPPKGKGIPPGGVGAAYWNFHVPGVIILFALLGIFHRWLARTYQYNSSVVLAPLYIYALLGVGVSPNSLVSAFQEIVMLLLVYSFLGIFRPINSIVNT
jgi:oligosaccharide repeat unit polymerase